MPKVQVADYRLYVYMHPTYVALREATLKTGAWLYGAHTLYAKTAAVSCGTSHVTTISAVSTPFQWISELAMKCDSHSFYTTCHKSAVSPLKSRE